MPGLTVAPELLTSAAAELNSIRSALNAARLAAAGPTTGFAAAAADEVSAAMAALFAEYGQEFQALGAQASAFHQRFVQALSAGAGSYLAADAVSASLLTAASPNGGIPGAASVIGADGTAALSAAINDTNLFLGRQVSIYNLQDPRGWGALVLDYTWGAPGTALGYGVQILNSFQPNGGSYDPVLSQQVGAHVYRGGIGLPGFATTMGNVTTHLGYGPGTTDLMVNHELVHVWQNRLFGPLFQTSYSAWTTGGTAVGTAYWLLHPDQDLFSLIETAAYYDNPWEVWAYVNDHNWPPRGANPALLWP